MAHQSLLGSPFWMLKWSQEASVWHLNPVNVRTKACPQHHSVAGLTCRLTSTVVFIRRLIDQTHKSLMWISACTQDFTALSKPMCSWSTHKWPNEPFYLLFFVAPVCQLWNLQNYIWTFTFPEPMSFKSNWEFFTQQDFVFQDHSLHLKLAMALWLHPNLRAELNHINSMLHPPVTWKKSTQADRLKLSVSKLNHSCLLAISVGDKVNLGATDQGSVAPLLTFSLREAKSELLAFSHDS